MGLKFEQFASYVETHPSRLGCWRYGKNRVRELLAWLNVRSFPVTGSSPASLNPDADISQMIVDNHSTTGIAAYWVLRYMCRSNRDLPIQAQDRQALWSNAEKYWNLRDLMREVRSGVRGFESKGHLIRLPYTGNTDMDALDRKLAGRDQRSGGNAEVYALFSSQEDLRLWMKRSKGTVPWYSAPESVRGTLRSLSDAMNDTYPADFLVIEEVAGFPLGVIYKYWRELLAFGYYMQMATMQGSEHLPTTAPIIAREDFVKFMADSARIPVEVADRVTTLLTMQREPNPDPALTPFVPLDGGLLPLSSLMVPASPASSTGGRW